MSDDILKKFKADFERSFGLSVHDLDDNQAEAIAEATKTSNERHWSEPRDISDDDIAKHQHAITTSWDAPTQRVPREPATPATMAKLQALLDQPPVSQGDGTTEVTALIGSNLEVHIFDDDDLQWYANQHGVDQRVVDCIAAMLTELEERKLNRDE
jgi:hypothetical protein